MPTLNVSTGDLAAVFPALALVVAGLAAAGAGAMLRPERRAAGAELCAYLGLAAALGAVILRLFRGGGWGPLGGFGGAVVLDDLALLLSLAVLTAAGLTVVLASDFLRTRPVPAGETYALLLLGTAGMVLLLQSAELITFFVSLEVLSLAVYALSGLLRKDPRSNEAAIKYFVIGAVATGFLIYGAALLYGATGTLSLDGMGDALRKSAGTAPLATAGLALLAVGLCFKVGAAPFHMWVPDVYEGAPTPVTAFMSVAVKASAFGAFLRVLLTAGAPERTAWGEILVGLALLTMVVGNFLAVAQRSVKRMLAYSSVAHTGYVLVAAAALRTPGPWARDAAASAVFYLFTYTFMTLGAFAFLAYAGRRGRDAEDLDDYAGLARRRPWAALGMTIFMASLAGLPPTAGFLAKFLVFRAAVAAGEIPLVLVGVLTSAVSVYYYLRVVVRMYMEPGEEAADGRVGPERPAPGAAWVVAAAAFFTVALGILPRLYVDLAYRSVQALAR
ncbi:MAG TPA: NADH-quinone oxidoreductase subunit N [Planctomycetota bacterium]|nr:NADH-quinone oxidoreductase subunit N [Planctomycetota bacterium]